MPADTKPLEGGCTCRAVRYRLASGPMFVNCCHCRWCQRETGASFALNALIEADRVTLLQGRPEIVDTPSLSGKGQKITRCPICRIALWSNYSGGGDLVLRPPLRRELEHAEFARREARERTGVWQRW